MTIAPELEKYFPMSNDQQAIVSHKRGPLCIIAGPGSGKTRSILFLVLNLLLCGEAQPSEVLLCTYTEKVAAEMQDRLTACAEKVGYKGDLIPLRISTIHSICKQILLDHIHYAPVENNFITLDQLEQHLLIFEHIHEICTPTIIKFLQGYWGSVWDIAKNLSSSFNAIVEDLLFENLKVAFAKKNFSSLQTDKDRLAYCLTGAYRAYQNVLQKKNCLDFAHQQYCVYKMLQNADIFPHVTKGLRYIVVDEYQDTSYIQEQILTLLASATGTNNLFVVGDEDQALYRFRGATVRNILQFEQKFPSSTKLSLLTNYRSHKDIIDTYNSWMAGINWTDNQGISYRTEKQIRPNSSATRPNGATAYAITYANRHEEAEQFADLVVSLEAQGKISDYSQVALLLHSVKPDYSAPYMRALQQRGISFFCPRARPYFEQQEVCLLIGCFMHLLDYSPEGSNGIDASIPNRDLVLYLSACRKQLQQTFLISPSLRQAIIKIKQDQTREMVESDVSRGSTFVEYFYRLITAGIFLTIMKDGENQAEAIRNLELFSQLLSTFQRHYPQSTISSQNKGDSARLFFATFLPLLYPDGLNRHEDAHQSFPIGHVPILTIHQAKGLEFPVVVVGRLDRLSSFSRNHTPQALKNFSPHTFVEPDRLISAFDQRRLYYVAFSRAKHLLILMASGSPGNTIAPLWSKLRFWQQAHIQTMPDAEKVEERFKALPRCGFTSHIQVYDTCPRRYHYFRSYRFVPASPGEYFAGQLIHYTLEYIHRIALDGNLSTLNVEHICTIFERKYQALTQFYLAPITDQEKNAAWQQILWYFQQNQDELQAIFAVEHPVRLKMETHIVTGKIDLLVKKGHDLALIDFKMMPSPTKNAEQLERYTRQLYFYAHALEQSGYQRPRHLFLYWTMEEHKEDALMEIPYDGEEIAKIRKDLQKTVLNIESKKFMVWKPPAREICQRCDLRHLCQQDRIIE